MDFDCDCDGFGLGWFFPALIVGKLLSEAFDRPQPWPATPPPAPQPAAPERAAPPVAAAIALHECAACRRNVSASFAFCPHCGTRLGPPACRFCGQTLKREMAYCPHCGGPAR